MGPEEPLPTTPPGPVSFTALLAWKKFEDTTVEGAVDVSLELECESVESSSV